MLNSHEAAARITAIDALQDELLQRLDDLERQTAAVLAQYQPAQAAAQSLLPRHAPAAPAALPVRSAA